MIRLIAYEQFRDRNAQTFLEDLARLARENAPADIGGMTGAGKVPDHASIFEDRRKYRHIVDLASGLPGIVRNQHVARLESFCRISLQEMTNAGSHSVDVTRCTGE